MTETEATDETPQAPPAPESGGVGLGPGLFVLMVLGLPLMVLAQTAFGLWEPWETSWAELAREMRQSGQWFAPSLGEKVVPRALLPIWLTAAGQALLGESEWGMRLPMALCVMTGLGALFVWLREVFGGWRALVAALAALTSPLIFFSGATLAGNGAFVGATMAAVACMGLVLGRKAETPSLPLMGALGLSLAACALSWGLWGLWLPLGIALGAGLSARGLAETGWQWSKTDGIALGVGGAITGGLLAWGGARGWETSTLQWLGLALPPVWLACGAAMAWSTRTVAIFKGLGSALVLGPPLVAVAVCAWFYAGAAPAETLAGDVPALTFLLENHLVTPRALPEHVTFDFWVRQIGFSAWPWTALLPLGLVYVLRRDTGALTDAEAIASRAAIDPAKTREDAPEHATRLILAWFVVSMLAALLLGTVHERYLFPAVAPIGLAVALALTDRAFWSALQDKPLLARALGLAVIFAALFLTKDLERYPQQLLGPLLTDGKFEAPEDFALGGAIKALRYGLALALMGYFMDAFAWPRRLWRWWTGRKTTDQTEPEAPSNEESSDTPDDDAIGQQASRLAEEAPIAQKEGVPGWMAALHARTRTPDGLAVALVVCGVIFLGLAGMRWVPELSHHLSQRGLLEAYETKAAPGEPLLTYQVSTHNASYYFSGLERLTSMAALKTKWGGEERVFVVLPNDRLSSLNYEIRKGTEPKRNIHVLDNRSSRYVLASNMLGEGEQERSAVAQAILPERPRPIYQITPKNTAGERVYGQFDKKIQLIGYEVYHEGEVDEWGNPTEEARAQLRARKKAGQPTVFKAGQKMVIRYFFKVLKRVTSSQKIFLHVDYPGTRINGDHVPVDEQFPTNHWLPGDYVVDTQRLDIEAGSPSGAYTMYMGFFLGSRRMEVTPKSGHDGSNRVKLGTIEVQSF